MPEAVLIAGSIAATAAASAVAGPLGTVIVGSITVGTVVGATIAVGSTLLAAELQSRDSAALTGGQGVDEAGVSTRVSSALRRWRVLGAAKTAGAFLAYDIGEDGDLWQLIAVASHRIDGIVEHRLDGRPVTLDGDGWVTAPQKWAGRVQILTRSGGHNVTFPQLVAQLPYWTDDHVGRGIAQVAIRQRPVESGILQRVYPRRRLQWTGIVRGDDQVWDPRTDTTGWTDNAALHLLRFLTLDPLDGGCGVPLAKINVPTFKRAADVCDEQLPLANGGTQARWSVGGVLEFAEDRRTAFRELLSALDGDLRFDDQGRWALRLDPTERIVRLTEDHVLGLEVGPGTPAYERATRVAPVIRSAQHDYREITLPPRKVPGATGPTQQIAMELKLVQSHAQAQRIAKRRISREWPDYAATAVITLAAARRVQSFGTVLLDVPGTPRVWRWLVQRVRKDVTNGTATLDLISLPLGFALWDREDEEPEGLPSLPETEGTVAAPAGVTVVATVVATDGGRANALRVAWAPPSDPSLSAELQVAEAGTGEWSGAGTAPAVIGRLDSRVLYRGRDYDVRIRFAGPDGAATEWTEVEATEVSAAGTQPNACTGLSALVLDGEVTVSATAPASGPVERVQFRFATVDDFAASSFLASRAADAGDSVEATRANLAAGTYYAWARARSAEDVDGPPTASVSFTIL
jgi:hypothetical protein